MDFYIIHFLSIIEHWDIDMGPREIYESINYLHLGLGNISQKRRI